MSAPTLKESAAGKDARSQRPRVFTILLLVAALIGSVMAWRMTTLQGLPNVPALFDPSEGVIAIPDDQNAYTWYRRATEIFSGPELWPMKDFTDMSVVTDAERRSLEVNRGALDIWLEGTKRTQAVCIQPASSNYQTVLRVDQKLRSLAQLAALQAFLLRSQGDDAGAWTWIKASLRAGRHVGANGFYMERLMGIGYYEWAGKQAMLWADDRKVNPKLLRQALDDILIVDAMTPSGRSTVRNEYFAAMNTFNDWEGREELRHIGLTIADLRGSAKLKYRVDSLLALAAREPERSRRILCLVLANWLDAADLPRPERKKRVMDLGKLTLFQVPLGSPNRLSTEEWGAWIESSYYAKGILQLWSRWESDVSRDEVNRGRLIVHFAEQLYLRERGTLPDQPEQLVGPYLKSLPTAYELPQESKPPGPSR